MPVVGSGTPPPPLPPADDVSTIRPVRPRFLIHFTPGRRGFTPDDEVLHPDDEVLHPDNEVSHP
eukprot:1188588-Prorocentrum_minimum.AAC.1